MHLEIVFSLSPTYMNSIGEILKFVLDKVRVVLYNYTKIQSYNNTKVQSDKDTIMKGGWMQIEIDLTSKVPIYVQIIDQVKHMIATGELSPDDQLPTVRQLATDLRVNFNTIARAYRMLDEEGLISTQHGRGTYILPIPSERNGELLRQQDLDWLTRHYLNEVAQLGYSAKDVRKVLNEYIQLWVEAGFPPAEHET